MEITGRAIIIGVHSYGESSARISLLSEEHGVLVGMGNNIKSKKNRAIYFPGNLIEFTWKARLPEHMGSIKCELTRSYAAAFMHEEIKLLAVNSLFCVIQALFKEREENAHLFSLVGGYLEDLSSTSFLADDYIRLELGILKESGYELDLSSCAATGSEVDLRYVSPKSGRAVSQKAGEPYHDKMLPLPQFLLTGEKAVKEEIRDSFILIDYFFNRYLFTEPYHLNVTSPRKRFVNYCKVI